MAEKLAGLLLAGGASKRLGRDKARLVLPGSRQTLAENARSILEAAGLPVIVAARDRERAETLLPGCTAIEDGPGRGPAAALLGAHAAYPDHAFVALACDMPLVPAGLLRVLTGVEGDWVVPAWSPGTLTPLPPSPADGRGGRTINSWRGFAPPTPQGEEAHSSSRQNAPARPGSSQDKDWGLGPGLRRGDDRGNGASPAVFVVEAIANRPGEPEGRSPSPKIGSPPYPSTERGVGGEDPVLEPKAGEPEGGTPSQLGSPPSPSAERGAGGRGPGLRLEPLCALYRPRALEALARRVAAGRFDLRGLAEESAILVARFEEERIAPLGDPAAIFRNINEARDLEAFAALPPRGSADTIPR